MSKFTEILTVSPLPDGKNWLIRKKFGYYIGKETGNRFIDVPINFKTDFASVPRLFWFFIPKWGKYGNATVIHDYCYWFRHISIKQKKTSTFKTISRREADRIFLAGMKVLEVPWYHKYPIYWAVRAFGWWPWFFHQRDKAKGITKVMTKVPKKVTQM